MSSSKGSSRVVPNTLTNLGLPFRACGQRAEGHHLKEGVGEEKVPKSDWRARVSSFPSSSLRFFDLGLMRDRGSYFKLLTWAYLSLLYLVAIFARRRLVWWKSVR